MSRKLPWSTSMIGVALTCLSVLMAATGPSTLRVQDGKRTLEMTDTSDSKHGLDLSRCELKLVYEADFTKPVKFIREGELFTENLRTHQPENFDWVLEGDAHAFTRNGRLHLQNIGSHLVLWNMREFPADFLLEFEVSPTNSNRGLGIVFFSATSTNGGSIFEPGQPKREGVFERYYGGGLNCYHVSYWATEPQGGPRGTAHIRKNRGFHLVAAGRDFIAAQGAGPHRVRILKLGGVISVEADGKISVRFADDGQKYGPVLGNGRIGLRQMDYSGECSYTRFKVWQVNPR